MNEQERRGTNGTDPLAGTDEATPTETTTTTTTKTPPNTDEQDGE